MQDLIEELSKVLEERKLKLVTAESCSGGQLAAAITTRPGSSKVFERGFVTYSNESKTDLLGVSNNLLKTHGAVSAECAAAMAKGAIENSKADIAISITGIAGPEGGSEEKPVGTVYFGVMIKGSNPETHCGEFQGTRLDIQTESVMTAIEYLIEAAEAAKAA